MRLFGRGKSGGVMNAIRCDEQDYLIWKWRPIGQSANSTSRENSIRWGSSLRVKDGEVAVFVYSQKGGAMQDFIVGPFDQMLNTANLPVLATIMGTAYGGDSPFQAEVYFINLAGNISIKFAVPYFSVFDPRFPQQDVPVAAGGGIVFNITDYRAFVKLNRLINFELDTFKQQIKDAVVRRVKSIITNAPMDYGYPLVQLERKLDDINDRVKEKLSEDLVTDFGVNLKRVDISRIEPDKESEGWQKLYNLTAGIQERVVLTQSDLNIQNMKKMQAMNEQNAMDTMSINKSNVEKSLQIQQQEAQRAQRLQSESNFMGAHSLDQQTSVLHTAAQNLGQMGNVDLGGGNGGMNPGGMMAGMMMGGAVGQQMAGMMNSMGQTVQNSMAAPPPLPQATYFVALNGQSTGPFSMQQLQQMVQTNQLTTQTLVWKQGMAQWAQAGSVAELTGLFAPPPTGGATPPPVPPTL